MKHHGIGVGYRYPHDFEGADVEQQYLPDALVGSALLPPARVGLRGDDRRPDGGARAGARGATSEEAARRAADGRDERRVATPGGGEEAHRRDRKARRLGVAEAARPARS